ncbi:MAG: ABC transporter permease [Candidatus Aenigmarchaeota archaeon]|nr:ABC transporter permease [Candidatus Aenigmarchaeota archaeon]
MIENIYTIWLREMIKFTRARSRIISSLALPFFWLAIVGIGFGSSFKLPNMDYLQFFAPGIVGMVVLFTSIFSSISVLIERQFGFLKEILVAPVSRSSIVVGKALGSATITSITAFIMILIAFAMGILGISAGIFPALAAIILGSLCFSSIGLILAAKMRSMEGFHMVMTFLVMPIFFLSGALFPLQNSPQWMQIISYFNPLFYVVDALRLSLAGTSIFPLWIDLGILVIAAFMILLGAAKAFRTIV